MNRLTKSSQLTENESMSLSLTNLYMRLQEYEDTGLEPEEVEAAKKIVAKLALADYPHNFRREKPEIVEYMCWIIFILKDAKEWWNGMVTRDKEADR